MATVLVTGFAPFDGFEENPSGQLARALDGRRAGDAIIAGHVLPVAFDAAGPALLRLVEALRPDAIVATGQAAGEAVIRLEQVAINRAHSARPDNAGYAPHQCAIDPDGPAARFVALDLHPLATALTAAGVPARVSFHAGTHCCNLVLYTALAVRPAAALFVHLPLLPTQGLAKDGAGPLPSMALAIMEQAVLAAAEAAFAAAGEGAMPPAPALVARAPGPRRPAPA